MGGCYETRVFPSCGRRYRHRWCHVDCDGPIIGGAPDRLPAGGQMGPCARRASGWGTGRSALRRSQQGGLVRASTQVAKGVSRCSTLAFRAGDRHRPRGDVPFGHGETADPSKAQPLPAGSFIALPPGHVHHVFIDEDTVIQISTNGPWDLNYVNPKDDPRQKTQ